MAAIHSLNKPFLRDQLVDDCQRHYILPLEKFPRAYAFFIHLFESKIREMLDDRNEDVFGVIFLKAQRHQPRLPGQGLSIVMKGGFIHFVGSLLEQIININIKSAVLI